MIRTMYRRRPALAYGRYRTVYVRGRIGRRYRTYRRRPALLGRRH